MTLTKVWEAARGWKERARAKSGGRDDAAGVPRARGKCTVVDVNPPTTGCTVGPVGPRQAPLQAPRLDRKSHRQRTGHRPACSRGIASLDDSMGYRLLREPPG